MLSDVFGITPDETMVGYKLSKDTKQKLANNGNIIIIFD